MNEFNLETRINYNEVVKSNASRIAHESQIKRLFSNGVHKKLKFKTRLKLVKKECRTKAIRKS